MKVSFVVATRNRAQSILPCLNSIANALHNARPCDGEIVAVDNGSTDETPEIIRSWAAKSSVAVQTLHEPQAGHARAQNRAVKASRGELLAFTDDDCRLHPQYVVDLLRHDKEDRDLVLRCGRVELGDLADLPMTISTSAFRVRWIRSENSARHIRMGDYLHGCNMTMRRALIERIGLFDERFGPGGYIGSGEDTDLFYRAYLSGAALEYVPDMTVFHHHGRKSPEACRKLLRKYTTANGAIFAHYIFTDYNLCYLHYRDLRNAARRFVTGDNMRAPEFLFSNTDLLAYTAFGLLKYLFAPRAQVEKLDTKQLSDRVRMSFRKVLSLSHSE